MVRSCRIACAVAVLIAAAAALTTTSRAADSGQKVGIVDMARIYTDAPRVKQYKETLDEQTQTLGASLEIRSQNLMLDDALVKQLIDLKTKAVAAQTDKDKATIKELEDKEHSLDGEFKTLQGVAQPTDQQKARLKELQEIQQTSKTIGEALEKDYNGRLKAKAQELDEKAKADIQESVNKVVTAKGITLVITKDAVLFGGTDITDDVINNLDRKAQ